MIFMTGVGTRALAQAIEPTCPRELLVAALSKVTVIARGPKPVAVLREFGVNVTLIVPEPNTWREILQSLDQNAETIPLKGVHVAGYRNMQRAQLRTLCGTRGAGAECFPVPVYKCGLRRRCGAATRRRFAISLLGKFQYCVIYIVGPGASSLFRFAQMKSGNIRKPQVRCVAR